MNALSDADRWPVWAQVTLALSALVLGGVLMIGMPLLLAGYLGKVTGDASGLHVWGPMIATLLGLTTMTVAGIFLFMTFRIDRGVRLRATEVSREVAREVARKAACIRVDEFLAGNDIQARLDTLLENAKEAVADLGESLESKEATSESLVDGLRTRVDDTDLDAVIREVVDALLPPDRVDEKLDKWLDANARRALAAEALRSAIATMEPEEAREFVRALIDAIQDLARSLDMGTDDGFWHRTFRWFRR